MTHKQADWRVGVDIGGTFTDIVLWDGAGDHLVVDKILTTPDDPSRAVLEGVRRVLETAGIGGGDLASVIHGTTLVANALIERKGVMTGLITTAGFRDVLEIGREWRYDLFDLNIEMPRPLVPRPLRFEAEERVGPDGAVLTPLDTDALLAAIAALRDAGVQSLAVCLLHAYVNPAHERAVGEIVRQAFPEVALSLSSDVSPELGEYERTSTTVANAYVHPIFRDYVQRLVAALVALGFERDLLMVLSDGRCVRADVAIAIRSLSCSPGPRPAPRRHACLAP